MALLYDVVLTLVLVVLFFFFFTCFHLKSIKSNLAKWFGSAKSYNSLIQILLYWDFIIRSESLCSKKWTSRSLRFCKSQTNLGFVNSEPFTTVVFTHLFLQWSSELKSLWLRQVLHVREKTLPQSYAGRNACPTHDRYTVFSYEKFCILPPHLLFFHVYWFFLYPFLVPFPSCFFIFSPLISISPRFLTAKNKLNNIQVHHLIPEHSHRFQKKESEFTQSDVRRTQHRTLFSKSQAHGMWLQE